MIEIAYAGPDVERADEILTPDALKFVQELHARFAARRDELLQRRTQVQDEITRTGTLDFLPHTREVRDGEWTVAQAPADLIDRRVEMTGPTDRKMTINALNSGAQVWLADLEDANTPHWRNVVGGQVNLHDAIRRTIEFTAPDGKQYSLATDARLATIVVRPRGWHLPERHLRVDGAAAVGALVDFGLYFFHNAHELIARGSGPYFYLPKLESHLEARLWNDVFSFAERALSIPAGTVRATVLIETVPAAFEMHEILYELREHASGLNAGRWDYLFSLIKKFRSVGPDFVLPDRNSVTMTAPFMRPYTQLLVRTCHQRGALAIGGMAAFIPSRTDAAANERAFAKVREDKTREADAGFDGSWVAHPDLVPLCRDVFDAVLGQRPNQLHVMPTGPRIGATDLLDVRSTPGQVSEAGVRNNVAVALRYLDAWLGGTGAVAINNLMEDAATAEIARAQLWQWVRNGTPVDGTPLTRARVDRIVAEEVAAAPDTGRLEAARNLVAEAALGRDFIDFLTLPAYEVID